jgi:hypothetical protein
MKQGQEHHPYPLVLLGEVSFHEVIKAGSSLLPWARIKNI